MASFVAARASVLGVLVVGGALAACSGDGDAGNTTDPGTTGTSTQGGGGTASSGGSGGTSAGGGGAGGTSTGGGGAGGATTTTGTGGGGAGCSGFAERIGGVEAADDELAGVVVDAGGGAIAVGAISGAVTVGGTTLTSAGARDVLVVRFAESGAVAWAKRFGSVYDDRAQGVAAMPDGGAVVVGTFDGTVDFGGTALASMAGPDAFVVRFGPTGEVLFAISFVNADARAVAVDDAGDLLVAGDFVGMTSFGDVALASAQNDVFVARVSATGSVLDAVGFASGAKPGALAIASGAGRTYLAGSFQTSLDFGTGPLVSAGSRDVFVARLDAALDAVMARRFGDDTSQEARAVAVLSDGSAAIAGAFRGKLDLDGTLLVADTQDDAFVARVDEAGEVLFGLRFGDASVQGAQSIAVDAGDGLVVAGAFEGTIDVGDGPVVSAGAADVFVTWLDPQGVAVKTERRGGLQDQRARSVAVDPCGAVVVGGDFFGTLPFGDDTLEATGGLDAFVGRIAP